MNNDSIAAEVSEITKALDAYPFPVQVATPVELNKIADNLDILTVKLIQLSEDGPDNKRLDLRNAATLLGTARDKCREPFHLAQRPTIISNIVNASAKLDHYVTGG